MKTSLLILMVPFLTNLAQAESTELLCRHTEGTGARWGAHVTRTEADQFSVQALVYNAGEGAPVVDFSFDAVRTPAGFVSTNGESKLVRQGSGYILTLNEGFLGAYDFDAGECR